MPIFEREEINNFLVGSISAKNSSPNVIGIVHKDSRLVT
jgi:hypothetical protein